MTCVVKAGRGGWGWVGGVFADSPVPGRGLCVRLVPSPLPFLSLPLHTLRPSPPLVGPCLRGSECPRVPPSHFPGGAGGGGRRRREASAVREGTAPLQPWVGILCAGNEKPSVAMETGSLAPSVILCGKFPRVRGGGGVQGGLLLHRMLECRRAGSGGQGMQGRRAEGTGGP